MTAARQFILDVHASIAELDTDIRCVVGKRGWSCHIAPPCIKWAYSRITWSPPDTIGGHQKNIITRVQSFDLAIWFDDEDDCSEALDNLIRACRSVAKGRPNFEPGPFDWLTEKEASWLNRGVALAGSLSVRIQIPKLPTPAQLATITSQQHTETIDPDG